MKQWLSLLLLVLFLCGLVIQGLRGQRVLLDWKVSIASNDGEGQGFVYIDKMCQKGVSGPL